MAILFDLDGTLLDTAPDFTLIVNQIRSKLRLPPLTISDIRGSVSHGIQTVVDSGFKDALHLVDAKDLESQIITLYKQNPCQETKPFPGMESILISLENAGIDWGVVTNKYQDLTLIILERLGYLKRAKCVVCGDTTPNPKPHPDPLLYACKKINKAPEKCVYIGDAERDIIAGKKAGMKTVTALFGYIPDIETAKSWGADLHIQHPSEILPWALQWI